MKGVPKKTRKSRFTVTIGGRDGRGKRRKAKADNAAPFKERSSNVKTFLKKIRVEKTLKDLGNPLESMDFTQKKHLALHYFFTYQKVR